MELTPNNPPTGSTPPNPPVVEKAKVTLEDAQQYLKQVTERVMSFAGKSGYNSYLFAQQSGLDELNKKVASLTNDEDQATLTAAVEFQYREPSLDNLKNFFVGVRYA